MEGRRLRNRGSCTSNGRCFRAVDSLSDGSSKLITIDEETDHQIVHRCRFGKANRASHETLDPGAQIDVFTLDFLRMLLANVMLLRIDMPLVGAPSIRVKPRDTKGSNRAFNCRKTVSLRCPKTYANTCPP